MMRSVVQGVEHRTPLIRVRRVELARDAAQLPPSLARASRGQAQPCLVRTCASAELKSSAGVGKRGETWFLSAVGTLLLILLCPFKLQVRGAGC